MDIGYGDTGYGDALGVVTRAPCPDRFRAHLPGRIVVVGAGDLPVTEQLARAAAVNRGVVALPPDVGWVLVADPQVRVGPGTVEALLAAAHRFPRAAALGPRLRTAGGRALSCAGALPNRGDLLRGRIAPDAPRSAAPVGWVSASCVLLRRAAFDSVDGFDPRHLGPVDGIDLADRFGRAGWLVVHVPDAEVVVGAATDPGMLESVRSGLRRYAADRFPVLSRLMPT